MAGIADSSTIDVVAQDADGTYLLVMVEDRPWGAVDEQECQLRDKINTYVSYILDGQLAQQYPETIGRPVAIRLDCLHTPTGHFGHIADHASAQLKAYGIGFRISTHA